METTVSKSGKGLGIASMVVGIITLIWSIIPIVGAGAFWVAIIGLLLGMAAMVMAVKGKNPKKGIIITGLILCVVAVAIAAYWMSAISTAVDTLNSLQVQ